MDVSANSELTYEFTCVHPHNNRLPLCACTAIALRIICWLVATLYAYVAIVTKIHRCAN